VLLFSQSLETLDTIERVLQLAPSPRPSRAEGRELQPREGHQPHESAAGWQPGLDYVRLDGQTTIDQRDRMVAQFNSSPPASGLRLFLISTRAGGFGLNLTAASRVILFDASWNPSQDTQAVHRAYRYGQRRTVYVYRLIAQGWEECLYRQQVVKLQLAGRVVDDQALEARYTAEEMREYYKPLPAPLRTIEPAPEGESGNRPPAGARPGANLAPESWLPFLASDPDVGPLLHSVEDHALRLGDTEDLLTVREMEDASNELLLDTLSQPRERAFCPSCHRQLHRISYQQLAFTCPHCAHRGLLPPAPPIVVRTDPNTGQPTPKLTVRWQIYGEMSHPNDQSKVLRTCLPPGGAYHVQWRPLPSDPDDGLGLGLPLGPDEGWVDGKKPVAPGKLIGKSGLSSTTAYQARVRARMSACECQLSAAVIAYALECQCVWTAWSPPSARATPVGDEGAPAAVPVGAASVTEAPPA